MRVCWSGKVIAVGPPVKTTVPIPVEFQLKPLQIGNLTACTCEYCRNSYSRKKSDPVPLAE